MVCKACGRNNPEGQVTCIGCNAYLASDNQNAGQSFGGNVNSPNTFSSSSFPTQVSGSYSGGFSSTSSGGANVLGLVASALFALSSVLPFAKITVAMNIFGISQDESKNFNVFELRGGVIFGLMILIVAAIGLMGSLNSRYSLMFGSGIGAVATMIYGVATFDSNLDKALKMMNVIGLDEYLKFSFDRGFGFWLFVGSAVLMIGVGAISFFKNRSSSF